MRGRSKETHAEALGMTQERRAANWTKVTAVALRAGEILGGWLDGWMDGQV